MPDSGSWRGRFLVGGAVLAICGFVLGVGVGGISGARADSATLTVTYTSASALQVKLGSGAVVSSGTVIPAGSYMVIVYDDPSTDPNPKLTISGPGVGLSSDLNSTGMGIDQPSTFGPYTFQTSSSYTVEDTNIGPSTLVSFTTTATATASGGSTSTGSSNPTSTSTMVSTSTTPAPKPVKPIALLEGAVSPSGKVTLSFAGKIVKTRSAGRYRITVDDRSKKAGLILGETSKSALTISGAAALGTHSRIITLTAGRWFVEASASGKRTFFSVEG